MASNTLELVIKAQDYASKELKKIEKQVKGLKGTIEKNRDTFKKMAKVGTIAFGALTAGIMKATSAYEVQAKAEALVSRGMERVAGTWSRTTDDMIKEAGRLQKESIFGDEEILQKVTNNLLTFGSVGEEVFMKAQQTALDLATTLEGDLQGSTIMLGKALENPAEGISALTRVGIAFTESQKEQIKALQASGDLMGAQTVILDEIEKMYGGAAKAASDAVGPTHHLKKELGDMFEVIGKSLRPGIDGLTESIRGTVEKVTNWITENPKLTSLIIKTSVAIAGVVAVLGTLGLIIGPITAGITGMITVVKGLGVALTFLATNPIGMVITAIAAGIAIGVLIVKNWETIKQKAIELGQYILQLYENNKILFSIFAPLIAIGIELVKNWDLIKETAILVGQKIQEVWTSLQEYTIGVFNNIKDTVIGSIQAIIDFAMAAVEKVTGAFKKIVEFKNKIKDTASSIGSAVSGAVSSVVSGARANGGPVSGGKTYLVGERGPELFTPSRSGNIVPNNQLGGGTNININMGGVVVKSEADENRLVDKIKRELTRTIQLSKVGIS